MGKLRFLQCAGRVVYLRVMVLLLLANLAVGVAIVSPVQSEPVAPSTDFKSPVKSEIIPGSGKAYTIGPEDVLDISVWGEAELSKTIPVSADGAINYPLLGSIPVQGITPQDLEQMLVERLSQGYLKDPKVTVSVKEYNSKKIMVFGQIKTPGLYRVKGELSVLELLFMVGNPTRDSGNRVIVMRRDSKNPQGQPVTAMDFVLDDLLLKGDLSKNVTIYPGDIVYLKPLELDKRRFYVMGQVRSPGPFDFERPITLLEAIKEAGGLTEFANQKAIQVIRREGEKKITLKFNVKEISKGKKKDDFLIQPGDVIVVPESWF